MTSYKLDFETIGAVFQVAKEFSTIPDDDLTQLGTTRPTVAAWTTTLRSLRSATRAASPEEGASVQLIDGDLLIKVTPVADTDQHETSFVVEDARHFQAVANHLVSLMGDREIFLRTGFETDELNDATRRFVEVLTTRS